MEDHDDLKHPINPTSLLHYHCIRAMTTVHKNCYKITMWAWRWMNCWRCGICRNVWMHVWSIFVKTKPPQPLTAGEDLIRHFKDSSHWSLTENKTDQTSLSRNTSEREREHCRIFLYRMLSSPGVSCPVVDDPQRANTVYVCAMFVCCEYQRGRVATSTLALRICQSSLVWTITFDGWFLSIASSAPNSQALSLWFSAVDMWNKGNMSQGHQAALFLSWTVSCLSPSWVVSSIIVHLPLPDLIALFCSPPYIHLTRPPFFSSLVFHVFLCLHHW